MVVILQFEDRFAGLRGFALGGGQSVLCSLAFIEDDHSLVAEPFNQLLHAGLFADLALGDQGVVTAKDYAVTEIDGFVYVPFVQLVQSDV